MHGLSRTVKKLMRRKAELAEQVKCEAERTSRQYDLRIDFTRNTLLLKSVAIIGNDVNMDTLYVSDLTRATGARLWKKMKQHFEKAPR